MMKEFDRLIGEGRVNAEVPTEPPTMVVGKSTIERLGAFIVYRSTSTPPVPDNISVIGGAHAGEPQPMHYFDSRGVKRLLLTAVERSTWKMWRAPGEDWNGPDGPGFNQRFFGEISADGNTIRGPWEPGLGPAGDRRGIDLPVTYSRKP